MVERVNQNCIFLVHHHKHQSSVKTLLATIHQDLKNIITPESFQIIKDTTSTTPPSPSDQTSTNPEIIHNASNYISKLTSNPQEDLESDSSSTLPPQKQKRFHLTNLPEPNSSPSPTKTPLYSQATSSTPLSLSQSQISSITNTLTNKTQAIVDVQTKKAQSVLIKAQEAEQIFFSKTQVFQDLVEKTNSQLHQVSKTTKLTEEKFRLQDENMT